MNKTLKWILKIVGGILITCILFVLGSVGLFHTDWIQNKAAREATDILSEHLQTKVEVGRVSVSLFRQGISIEDLTVEDRQQRKMLQMKELGVSFDLWRFIRHEVYITKAYIRDLDAKIYIPATENDTVPNFRFVMEAIQSNSVEKKKEKPDTVSKHPLTLDVDKLDLEHIKVSLNDTTKLDLGALHFRKGRNGERTSRLENLSGAFVKKTKKGPVDHAFNIGSMEVKGRALLVDGKWTIPNGADLAIDDLTLTTNNHKPRKNANKPKRGFFDAGHFDILAKLRVHLDSIGKDTVRATVISGDINDRGSGLHVTDLACKIATNKKTALVSDFIVKMANTTVTFNRADLLLPSKKEGRKFSFKTSVIKGTTLLKDISRPFAPVLAKFTMPVSFQTVMSGSDEGLYFRDIHVYTPKQQLKVDATGYITGLKDKYKLHVHFDIQRMSTSGKHAIDIINLFPLKRKFMMKQVDALGRIGYTGYFEVLWKREQFFGTLTSQVGNLGLQFYIDENNKFLVGKVNSDSLELGKAMDMPDLGKIAAKADFRFDISKPRTAEMRKRLGGKLPIGIIRAEVTEAQYKKIKVRNVFAEIISNGAVAEGNIVMKGKRMDVLCGFSFTNTNEMRKTRIKPGVRFHGLSDEDRAAKEAKKAAKRAAKDSAKAVKLALKEERKALKAERKAERQALKEEQKLLKAELKAEKKAAKDSAKAARKAAKEAAKAAKAAAKAA